MFTHLLHTWRMGPHLVSSDRITPNFKAIKFGHMEGVPQPGDEHDHYLLNGMILQDISPLEKFATKIASSSGFVISCGLFVG